MRIILLAMLLTGVTSCITYPSSVKRYECSEKQKERLEVVVGNCINSTFFNAEYRHESVLDKCYAVGLRTVCSPIQMFQWETFPFGGDSKAIPCTEAFSFAENWACDR